MRKNCQTFAPQNKKTSRIGGPEARKLEGDEKKLNKAYVTYVQNYFNSHNFYNVYDKNVIMFNKN